MLILILTLYGPDRIKGVPQRVWLRGRGVEVGRHLRHVATRPKIPGARFIKQKNFLEASESYPCAEKESRKNLNEIATRR